jgi:hypothetical protein
VTARGWARHASLLFSTCAPGSILWAGPRTRRVMIGRSEGSTVRYEPVAAPTGTWSRPVAGLIADWLTETRKPRVMAKGWRW